MLDCFNSTVVWQQHSKTSKNVFSSDCDYMKLKTFERIQLPYNVRTGIYIVNVSWWEKKAKKSGRNQMMKRSHLERGRKWVTQLSHLPKSRTTHIKPFLHAYAGVHLSVYDWVYGYFHSLKCHSCFQATTFSFSYLHLIGPLFLHVHMPVIYFMCALYAEYAYYISYTQ